MSEQGQVLLSVPASRFQSYAKAMFAYFLTTTGHIVEFEKLVRLFAAQLLEFESNQQVTLDDALREGAQELITGSVSGPLGDYMRHIPLLNELLFCRLIDNFVTYISDLLTLVFTHHPNMIVSSQTITVEFALQHATREELRAALIEDKVIALSFKGMRELNANLANTLGFAPFEDNAELERACILIEKRNLIAHNRGIVNRRYLDRVPLCGLSLGEKLNFDDVKQADLKFIVAAVHQIDARAESKFGIPRQEVWNVTKDQAVETK